MLFYKWGKKLGIRTEDKDEKYEPTWHLFKTWAAFSEIHQVEIDIQRRTWFNSHQRFQRFQIVVVKQTNCSKAELSGESAMWVITVSQVEFGFLSLLWNLSPISGWHHCKGSSDQNVSDPPHSNTTYNMHPKDQTGIKYEPTIPAAFGTAIGHDTKNQLHGVNCHEEIFLEQSCELVEIGTPG